MSSLPLFNPSDQGDTMSEKQQQQPQEEAQDKTLRQPYALGVRPGQRERRSRWVLVGFVVLAILATIHLSSPNGLTGCLHAPFRSHSKSSHSSHGHSHHHKHHGHGLKAKNIGGKSPSCPAQPDPIQPETKVNWTEERKKHSAELHAQAVQHATQSYDDNGEPGEDERWEPFHTFLEWWRGAFPTAVERANIEMINSELTGLSSRQAAMAAWAGGLWGLTSLRSLLLANAQPSASWPRSKAASPTSSPWCSCRTTT